MLNKRSFDLKENEKKAKATEKLYQPKKTRYCKYIVFPLLIGFIALLILINVDFTGEAYDQIPYDVPTNDRMFSIDQSLKDALSQIKLPLSRGLNCKQSICSLSCSEGNINNLYKLLEPLYQSCKKDLDLTLKDCSFPGGRIKTNFFEGNYRLKTLNIIDCELTAFDSKAFVRDSVKNLKNLTLLHTQLVALDATSFEGLGQLEYFNMINQISWTGFKGLRFLQSFSQNLTTLSIQQQALESTIYDPLPWLEGANMESLKSVNLSYNNFQNILNVKTFETLIAVEYLDLSNCSLTYLESETFQSILITLKKLDLSFNHLTTLSGEMLMQMNGLELDLSQNFWTCSCDNKEMLQIVKWNLTDIVFVNRINFKCYSPAEWNDIAVDNVDLEWLRRTTVAVSRSTYDETSDISRDTSSVSTPIQDNTTATAEIESTTSIATTDFTLESSSHTSSSSSSSSSRSSSSSSCSSSSSSESEDTETNDTTNEIIETTSSIIYTSTIGPIEPTINIYCNVSNKNYTHRIIKEKANFTIRAISDSAIKVISKNLLSNIGIFYFLNSSSYNISSRGLRQRQQYYAIINNLNSSMTYVFCLVQKMRENKYNWKISPFDCRSFGWPEMWPQPWIETEDQIWIICLVILGVCLMLFLGIILVALFTRRRRKGKSAKRVKTLERVLEEETSYMEPSSCGYACRTERLYVSQHQPPDVLAQYVKYNSNQDLYEELIM